MFPGPGRGHRATSAVPAVAAVSAVALPTSRFLLPGANGAVRAGRVVLAVFPTSLIMLSLSHRDFVYRPSHGSGHPGRPGRPHASRLRPTRKMQHNTWSPSSYRSSTISGSTGRAVIVLSGPAMCGIYRDSSLPHLARRALTGRARDSHVTSTP